MLHYPGPYHATSPLGVVLTLPHHHLANPQVGLLVLLEDKTSLRRVVSPTYLKPPSLDATPGPVHGPNMAGHCRTDSIFSFYLPSYPRAEIHDHKNTGSPEMRAF